MQEETVFETHDLYLASFLLVAGCELKNRRKQGQRIFFVFTNVAGSINALREDFFAGRAKVIAITYAEAVRRTKEMCFDP